MEDEGRGVLNAWLTGEKWSSVNAPSPFDILPSLGEKRNPCLFLGLFLEGDTFLVMRLSSPKTGLPGEIGCLLTRPLPDTNGLRAGPMAREKNAKKDSQIVEISVSLQKLRRGRAWVVRIAVDSGAIFFVYIRLTASRRLAYFRFRIYRRRPNPAEHRAVGGQSGLFRTSIRSIPSGFRLSCWGERTILTNPSSICAIYKSTPPPTPTFSQQFPGYSCSLPPKSCWHDKYGPCTILPKEAEPSSHAQQLADLYAQPSGTT